MMRKILTVILIFVTTACAFTRADDIPLQPTATTVRVIAATPVPTVDRQNRPVPTLQPEASPTPDTCQDDVTKAVASHVVTANTAFPVRHISVSQKIAYWNRTEADLSQIILNVEPNRWPGAFQLDTIGLDNPETPLTYELTGRRLAVELPQTLESGCQISLHLSFQLNIPPISEGIDAYKGYFGHSWRQVNLGHWLPTIAVYNQDDWITREASPIGEQDVLDTANWDITITIQDAPSSLQIAAPGEMTQGGAGRWRYIMENSREFALSISDEFMLSQQTTEGGVTVELYSFSDALHNTDNGPVDSAPHALKSAVESLAMYEDLYGDYPYSRLVIVQGDFPDGMELSSLVFVGGQYFHSFTGTPAAYLTLITVHEVAHQWWYARVGNDSALNPWLDEALATYSEYVYIEEYYPELKDWWWEFRIDRLAPEGFVDSTVYDFPSIRAYINAVYLRGVRMLHDLRNTLGTDAFFDWLRHYAEAGDGKIAQPELFWSLLSAEQFAATEAIRQTYLRQPQIAIIAPSS